MRVYMLMLAIVLTRGSAMLCACDNNQPEDPGPAPWNRYRPVYSNDIPIMFDEQSELTYDDFYGIGPITELNIRYPITAVRENEDMYYTVYSLQGGELAYVVFAYRMDTGIDFFIDKIIVYPYSSPEQEQELWFLLPQDLPEVILGRE
jgi:hypothetical protein